MQQYYTTLYCNFASHRPLHYDNMNPSN